jgi:hypothetical protein
VLVRGDDTDDVIGGDFSGPILVARIHKTANFSLRPKHRVVWLQVVVILESRTMAEADAAVLQDIKPFRTEVLI